MVFQFNPKRSQHTADQHHGRVGRCLYELLNRRFAKSSGRIPEDQSSKLRANFARFLTEIISYSRRIKYVRPDDPPLDILDLPRVVSNEEDIARILDQHDSLTNGLTLCSGSFGANPANDLPAIPSRFADRIHFTHLRNIRREPDGSFQEAAHLDGDTDIVALVKYLLD